MAIINSEKQHVFAEGAAPSSVDNLPDDWLGYSLSLMAHDTKLQEGVLYLKEKNGKVAFSVITLNKQQAKDIVLQDINAPSPFDLANLYKVKLDILQSVSELSRTATQVSYIFHWTVEFGKLCASLLERTAEESLKLQNDFTRHAGPAATYTDKKNLHARLLELSGRLSAKGENELSPSDKAAVASKLEEGAAHCTAGFHNRVNEAVGGFYLPDSIDALLTRIRKEIIDVIARKSNADNIQQAQIAVTQAQTPVDKRVAQRSLDKLTGNEVHTHNRFFVVAENKGYGVKPSNPHDIYRGTLSDDEIENLIPDAFSEQYQPAIILTRLFDGIENVLQNYFGYTGKKELKAQAEDLGYLAGDYGKFLTYLEKVFSPREKLDERDYLICDEDCRVVDLNWNKIKQMLFETLVEQQYIIVSDAEIEVMLKLLDAQMVADKNDNQEIESSHDEQKKEHKAERQVAAIDVSPLVKHEFINNTCDLISVLSFVDKAGLFNHMALVKAYVKSFLPFEQIPLINEIIKEFGSRTGASSEGQKNLIPYIALWALDEYRYREALLHKNQLTIALEKKQDLFLAAAALDVLDIEEQKQVVMAVLSDEKSDALFYAVRASSLGVLAAILPFIGELNERRQLEILTYARYGSNALMVAIRDFSEVTKPFFEFFGKLPWVMQAAIMKQTNNHGDNALINAAYYHPETIEQLLKLISAFPLNEQEEILKTTNDKDKINALGYMLSGHKNGQKAKVTPNDMGIFLNVISKLPAAAQLAILTNTGHSDTLLQNILKRVPQHSGLLLAILNKMPKAEQLAVLTTKNSNYQGLLSVFLDSTLFGFKTDEITLISQLSQQEQVAFLMLPCDFRGENSLSCFARAPDVDLKPLFAVIGQLPKAEQAKVLKQTNRKGYNALMIAVSSNPKAAETMLDYIKDLDVSVLSAILTQKSSDTDNTVLRYALHSSGSDRETRQKNIALLITLLSKLSERDQLEILTHTDSFYHHNNALLWAVRYDAETAPQFLTFIGRQSGVWQAQILPKNMDLLNYTAQYHPNALNDVMGVIRDTWSAKDKINLYTTGALDRFQQQFKDRSYKLFCCEIMMLSQLETLAKKVAQFEKLPNKDLPNSPYRVAGALHSALNGSFVTYEQSERDAYDIQGLKRIWTAYIDEASPVLSQHRGMKDIFVISLLCLTIIGAVYVAYQAIVQHKQGNGFFALTKTDSADKLEDMLASVETISRCSI